MEESVFFLLSLSPSFPLDFLGSIQFPSYDQLFVFQWEGRNILTFSPLRLKCVFIEQRGNFRL
jgi:hypothetical protein